MAEISGIITFIPTIGDNHSKDESERFSVKLKAVNVAKKQSQLRKFVEMDPKKLMKEMMSDNQQSEIRSLLTDHFVRFVNFDYRGEATAEDVEKKVEVTATDGTKVLLETVGQEYKRPMTMTDVFNLGEFELAMEIFMYLIGSSQLRRTLPVASGPGGGGRELPTVTEEREDEEKNSESPFGSSTTH